MNERISALMDGELESDEARSLLPHVRAERAGRDCWAEYHLIGDALRRCGHLEQDISARVMDALASAPVVLAPQAVRPRPALSWMAMAASVAAVMLVGGVLWNQQLPEAVQVVKAGDAAQVPEGLRGESLQAYLVAHQTHAPAQTMHGASHYLKTVAVVESGARD